MKFLQSIVEVERARQTARVFSAVDLARGSFHFAVSALGCGFLALGTGR